MNVRTLLTARHPLLTLLGYGIAIGWAVMWGMVIGLMVEVEMRPRAEDVRKRPPTPDHSPSPEVFRGLT